MKLALKLGAVIVAMAVSASAAELAVLRNGFTLKHERHQVMGDTTRLYMGASDSDGYVDVATDQIVSFQPAPPDPQPKQPGAATQAARTPVTVDQAVAAASDSHDVDPDLINSVIHFESRGNTRAVSPKGAQGLMQLMPGTAAELGVKNSFDTAENVNGGTQYLHDLLVQYDGDLVKALAAYNAGPKAVARYHGVPPYRETRAYVANIVRDFNRKKTEQQKATAAPATSKKPAKSQPSRKNAEAVSPSRAPDL